MQYYMFGVSSFVPSNLHLQPMNIKVNVDTHSINTYLLLQSIHFTIPHFIIKH